MTRHAHAVAEALLISTLTVLSSHHLVAQSHPDFLGAREPHAQLLLVGTFHFQDAGLDAYKPKFPLDVLSPARQREVREVVDRLAAFRPTKVAVEFPRERQARLDSLYADYLAGKLEGRTNEIFQLGFRLARQLGLKRVWAVDAQPDSMFFRLYDGHKAELDAGDSIDAGLNAAYMRLYAWDDSTKTVQTLRQTLLYVNSPERVRKGHGNYELGSFKVRGASGYLGADMGAAWYDRNLRIYRNLLELADAPGQRVILFIGAGHLPILRFVASASPEVELVDVARYLK